MQPIVSNLAFAKCNNQTFENMASIHSSVRAYCHQISRSNVTCINMMTSSYGDIFRVTGHLCGITGEFPAQRAVRQSFDVFVDLLLNERFSKQSWGWWFETPSSPLLRYSNELSYLSDIPHVPLKHKICDIWWKSVKPFGNQDARFRKRYSKPMVSKTFHEI